MFGDVWDRRDPRGGPGGTGGLGGGAGRAIQVQGRTDRRLARLEARELLEPLQQLADPLQAGRRVGHQLLKVIPRPGSSRSMSIVPTASARSLFNRRASSRDASETAWSWARARVPSIDAAMPASSSSASASAGPNFRSGRHEPTVDHDRHRGHADRHNATTLRPHHPLTSRDRPGIQRLEGQLQA